MAALGSVSSAIAAPYEVTWTGGNGDYNSGTKWTAFSPPFTAPYNRPDTTVENPFLNIANGSTATISGAAEGAFLMLGMRPGESGNLIINAGSNTVTLGELRVGGAM